MLEHEIDDRPLRWWLFITVTGKHEVKTTSVTCYYLVNETSPGSVFTKHLIYMSKKIVIPP